MPRKAPNPLPQDETGYQHFKNLPGRNNRDPALTAWYDRDAKLGLFIHWGIYSVPGWASTQKSVIDFLDPKTDWKTWFSNNAYSEWYLHTIRIEGSPAQKHHEAVFGKDYEYYEFAKPFNDCVAKSWKPEAWSDLFARSGFRYVVLTTKHHDGFTLFPSDVPNPNMPKGLPKVAVDIVGKLTDSVRKSGMEMGLYYSGWWRFPSAIDGSRILTLIRVPKVVLTGLSTPEWTLDAGRRCLLGPTMPSTAIAISGNSSCGTSRQSSGTTLVGC
jgi:hypothetical protein